MARCRARWQWFEVAGRSVKEVNAGVYALNWRDMSVSRPNAQHPSPSASNRQQIATAGGTSVQSSQCSSEWQLQQRPIASEPDERREMGE